MQFKKSVAIALIATVCGLTMSSAQARTLTQDGTPAEFPPASYKGKQYVDSRGCVFIRAGVDGAVTWVPRVARDRQLVCGFQPTFATTTPQPAPEPAPQVVKIVPEPEPAPVAKPVARKVASKPKPKAKPAPVMVAKKPEPVVAEAPVVVASAEQQCAALTVQSRRYISHPSADVRCGPQSELPHYADPEGAATMGAPKFTIERRMGMKPRRAATTTVIATKNLRPGMVVTEGQIAGNVRVVPRHVYEQRANALTVTKPPKGYRLAWDDDRLNPHRAEQTFDGKAKMDAIWTQTVPRRLISVPATDIVVAEKQAVKTVVATKGAPAQKTMQFKGNTFLQVAAYETSADAQTVARRVKALGLPVRIGKVAKAGMEYRLVLAGPFASEDAAQTALQRARAAGYSNAKLR